MTSFTLSKNSAILAVLSAAVVVVTAPSAIAMPVGGSAPMIAAPSLQRVADQHRVYPGSDNAAAEKARAERNAPNRFCEKQTQYCE